MNVTKIKASSGWRALDLKELIKYRDLLYFLTIRGIKAKYAQSVLGVGWAIVQPLFMVLIFTVIFGNLAKVGSDGAPYVLFSLCAMVPWTYFSGTLTEASNAMVGNANMISKVYFPRLVLPLSAIFSKLLDFIIGFVLLVIFLIAYRVTPSWDVLWLPLLIVLLLMCALGLGLILAAMSVQYRDVKHMVPFLVQILIYIAPVVYPVSNIPEQYRLYYALNPMVGVIEGFRSALLGTNPMPWNLIAVGTAVNVAIFIYGLYYFRRMEKHFADVV
jgi:lipopolysaccharide transport system permease protein